MIEPPLKLSVRRQCELLRVCRSGLYYEPEPTSSEQLELMRRIDELHLKWPFYGSRKITQALRQEGREVNRKRVQRLMRLMDLSAIAPKPNTSRAAAEHPVYPYLLRNLKIQRVDQVWASDIERHEALSNRAVVKGHGRRSVAADWLKLRAAGSQEHG